MRTGSVTTLAAALSLLLTWGCGPDSGGSETDAGTDVQDDPQDDALDDALDDGREDADAVDDAADAWDAAEDVEEEPDPEWDRFLAAREGYLRLLSEPILYCVAQEDTENPAFHGCIDWHSAVEGAWALHVLARILGDAQFTDALAAMLPADAIAAELDQLETGGPIPTEIPYGYSWFLALAVERERAGLTDMVALADVITADLVTHVTGLTRSRIDGAVRATDYTNISWVVLNIWLHATYVGDDDLATQMEDFTRTEILPREMLCPISRSAYDDDEFFAPCMHRARLIITALTGEEARAWAEYGIPEGFVLEPITEPSLPHVAGLNFSRAWDLLDLYEVSGDRSFRMMYIEHIETHMAMPRYWRDDYDQHSHWVPQFGVYAIARSYE